MEQDYFFSKIALNLTIFLAVVFFVDFTTSRGKTSVKKQEYGEVRTAGQVAEHKLTGKKCLVRDYGYRPEGVFQVTDYSKIECVFEDGSAKWVFQSEYKVKY